MFKNIKWADLLGSKTFWGAIAAAIPLLVAAWGHYQQARDLWAFLKELGPIIGGLLAAIGLIDRTATPNAGQG